MKLIPALVALCAFATAANAQDDIPKASKASQKYREYREQNTSPSYGLAKVEALIKKYKLRDKEEGKLPAKEYAKLSTKEKFTYHMVYGESASQNCDATPTFVDEEKHIYAYPPGAFQDERTWSDDQRAIIKKNRAAFLPLLKETIVSKARIGCNLKQAIMDLDAVELIPTICDVYKQKRYDHDILSMLMIMMKEGKFQPFLDSQSYKKLYADEAASYQSFLMANRENQDLVLSRAMAYYKQRTGK